MVELSSFVEHQFQPEIVMISLIWFIQGEKSENSGQYLPKARRQHRTNGQRIQPGREFHSSDDRRRIPHQSHKKSGKRTTEQLRIPFRSNSLVEKEKKIVFF